MPPNASCNFSTRATVIVKLPVDRKTEILRPEQIIVQIGNNSHDFGAYCYAKRSTKARRNGGAKEVDLNSFLPNRVRQIRELTTVFSSFLTDKGNRAVTVSNYAHSLREFMDWADSSGHHDCLDGGDESTRAYRAFVGAIEERYRRHEFESANAAQIQKRTAAILEALTGLEGMTRGLRLIQDRSWAQVATEPANEGDFADVLALNEAIFVGLSDLVLERRPFPFKLDMPKSLGWKDSFLWIFPVNTWRLPPYLWGAGREALGNAACWAYDFENGRLAEPDEIRHRYHGKFPSKKLGNAKEAIDRAKVQIESANLDDRHKMRLMLAAHAQNAFFFLFLANTGANLSTAQSIESDGSISTTVANQGYRVIKYRANAKEVAITIPVAFMPHLRRFLKLRSFLLGGSTYPLLFFTIGRSRDKAPEKIGTSVLQSHYNNLLLHIHPKLFRMASRQIRATVSDYFRRNHDAGISARLLGHSEEVAAKSYTAGSSVDHIEDMSRFLTEVSTKAREQKIVQAGAQPLHVKPLQEGGACASFGYPIPLLDNMPVETDCRTGCLFCANRILAASEDDARKVASAAYLMEQLIRGPAGEAEFRPKINKCDDDLERIAAFPGCREMVTRVKHDVYENGNLTDYFADKFHLFLELGVL